MRKGCKKKSWTRATTTRAMTTKMTNSGQKKTLMKNLQEVVIETSDAADISSERIDRFLAYNKLSCTACSELSLFRHSYSTNWSVSHRTFF